MEKHSIAYNDFINQISATGYQKAQGYDPDLLNKIYDNERIEVEKMIVELFSKGDRDVDIFLPQLKIVDGIALLKEELKKWPPPSIVNARLAHILYKVTNEDYYEGLLIENLMIKTNCYRSVVVGYLLDCKPSKKLESIFKRIYQNDADDIARFKAAIGFLYCKGLLSDTRNIDNDKPMLDLIVALSSENKEEMKRAEEIIDKLSYNSF